MGERTGDGQTHAREWGIALLSIGVRIIWYPSYVLRLNSPELLQRRDAADRSQHDQVLMYQTSAAAVLAYQNRSSLLPSPLALESPSSPAAGANAEHDPAKKGRVVISLDELAKHNTKESLWVAIDGDVWE
jgi:hypothetical protein